MLHWTFEKIRFLHYPQAIFWFETTFSSDIKEQEVLPVAFDLANLLVVQQPKICVYAAVADNRGQFVLSMPMELIWNPLAEQLEAATCPACGNSTFEFRLASKKSKPEYPLVFVSLPQKCFSIPLNRCYKLEAATPSLIAP